MFGVPTTPCVTEHAPVSVVVGIILVNPVRGIVAFEGKWVGGQGCAGTHTEIAFWGAVQAGGGSDRDFCVTGPHTRSILVLVNSYPMSGQTAAPGGS